jgi:nucleotide-binding universal stress UspA family protein
MKILIAYDGSECADAALIDLQRAGLPDKVDALVMSAIDVFIPNGNDKYIDEESFPMYIPIGVQISRERVKDAFKTTELMAEKAANKVREMFPDWSVESEAIAEPPHWAIITKGDEWKPDLIIVGSHGRTAFGRAILGSVSQKVLHEAHCSVRISRGRKFTENKSIRLILATDGSPDSDLMVDQVASRKWNKGTQIKLVTAVEMFPHNPVEPGKQMDRIRDLQTIAIRKLKASGADVIPVLTEEDPKHFLIREAKRWQADCIFLGAKGHRFLERFLIGSVSSAVAARAVCSVEVVR